MRAFGVCMDDVGVAHVNHADVFAKVSRIILMVVGACMAEAEQG